MAERFFPDFPIINHLLPKYSDLPSNVGGLCRPLSLITANSAPDSIQAPLYTMTVALYIYI
jgi:hypothetical protein